MTTLPSDTEPTDNGAPGPYPTEPEAEPAPTTPTTEQLLQRILDVLLRLEGRAGEPEYPRIP